MFSDDDKTIMENPGGGEDKTEAMGSADKPEKPKKGVKGKDDWQTVQQPKVQRPAAAAPSAPASAPSAPPAASTPAAAPPPMSSTAVPAGTSAMPPAPGAAPTGADTGVPLGSTLANMGIRDKTAQIAVLAIGGFLVLCCGCSCIGTAISFASSNF
jgi:hypothetical protein